MRYLAFALLILSACTFTVQETRDPASTAATRTAKPLPALDEGRIRIWLKRPPVDIAPQVGVPDWEYVVTPTPTKEGN